jgi:mono/diheme cytochrome c family protein
MSVALKWLGRIALAIVLLLVVAAGVVYALSERVMNREYAEVVELDEDFSVPSDPASVAEGERLARIRGCYNGCHGEHAEGNLFFDDFAFGTMKAPDLTQAVHSLSDAELERVIRHGIRADGSPVYVMPSPTFYNLSDEDLGDILAFLRSLPRSDGPETMFRPGPMARVLLGFEQFEPAAATIDHDAPRLPTGENGDPMTRGRYLAMTACTECHGMDLEGSEGPPEVTPSLRIVASYSPEEFRTLLRTGEPRDGRDLRLMDDMSRKRFSHLTDAEIDALHIYLSLGLSQQTSGMATPAASAD